MSARGVCINHHESAAHSLAAGSYRTKSALSACGQIRISRLVTSFVVTVISASEIRDGLKFSMLEFEGTNSLGLDRLHSRTMTVISSDIEGSDDQSQSGFWVQLLREGGAVAQANFFEQHREGLRRFALSLLDPRLRQRLDESDIVQNGFIRFKKEIGSYLEEPKIPPSIWLRRIIRQTVWSANRQHLDAQARDPRREIGQGETSSAFGDEIAKSMSSVGNKASREEMRVTIRELVELMPLQQREILWLIHVEACSLREAASELEITYEAAKKRYRRALTRLLDRYGDKLKQLT